MSFLNFALLGGVAAFLVPLTIHLLNRSRHQSIDWGAMHLLEAALQVNSRRFQWESILLLLLRCLIPILFAIGLARPVLTSLQSSAAQGEASMVIMLDNSLSMQATDRQALGLQGQHQSRFESAVHEVRQLLSSQKRADLSLWSSGGAPVNVVDGSTFDVSLALRSLATIQPGAGPSDPTSMISAGVAQLASMTNPNKQLIIASDFQSSQWDALSVEQLQRLKSLLDSGTQSIQLSLLSIAGTDSGNSAEPEHNMSVELSPEIREALLEPIFAYDSVTVTTIVHNWGNRLVRDVNVIFSVDNQILASEPLNLQPNSKQQVQFGCSFKSTGRHVYKVGLVVASQDADKMSGDDMATGVIDVREPIQVVIVDPAVANNTNQFSVGRFLQLALSPVVNDNSFQVRLLPRMPPVEDLRKFDVLAIVGSNFDDNMAKHVTDFVQNGGGLLLIPADNMDHGRLNRLWFDETRLLPGRYVERKTNAKSPLRIKQQQFQDSVFSIFKTGEHGDLSSVQSQQWQAIELESTTTATASTGSNSSESPLQIPADSTISSLLTLEDDTAVIARRLLGQGAVIQLGISPSPKWSNLSTRPVFVPLMQRLVIDLVGEGVQLPQQLLTGQSLSLTARQFRSAVGKPDFKAKVRDVTEDWSLIDPQGNRVKLLYSNSSVDQQQASDAVSNSDSSVSISSPALRWPGVYRLIPSADTNAVSKIEDAPAFVAAAVPSSESDLRLLNQSQLDQLAKGLGATIVHSADDYQALLKIRRDGQEVWRPLLVLLLVFLFAEMFLARRVTRGV